MSHFITKTCIDLTQEIDRLASLTKRLKEEESLLGKISILEEDSRVSVFPFAERFQEVSKEAELVIKSLLAIRQFEVLFNVGELSLEEREEKTSSLIETLLLVESFYREMGGIVGYQWTLLQFLYQPKQRFLVDKAKYHSPCGVDLSSPSCDVNEMIYHSIHQMEGLSEMYPVGGAADRLRLQDPDTGSLIPAAMLMFNGKTLLGKLIEDLQAREYLHFKVLGKQVVLPVAMMTSQEKNNHQQIVSLCEKNDWFYRDKGKFSLFCQPLVPVVNREGDWILLGPMKPLLKPGGHGVIWKLARDRGVISWLSQQGASKAIVRQINNPVSSEDMHLLAFSGYGIKENKRFGFASCERQVKASEGINVVVEEEKEHGFSYTLTNIEYCDFQTYKIQDEPATAGGRFSKFPSNTNLLFVDLPSILEALEEFPIPGMLVNVKKVSFYKENQEVAEEEIARLESTMQNMADYFQKTSSSRLQPEDLAHLDTYITFNKRQKTISATKKEFSVGASLLETPEGCFIDVLANTRDLLENYCEFQLPKLQNGIENFTSPSFLFYSHPSLGPLYSIISKKLRKGILFEKSELRLQIAECDIENLSVEGSCLIEAERIMGEIDSSKILRYSNHVGRCTLKNVTIKNKGIDYSQENIFWKPELFRLESFQVFLEGESEFFAQDITFEGDFMIKVPHGWKFTAFQKEGKVFFEKEKISSPTWHWKYFFDEKKALQIKRSF